MAASYDNLASDTSSVKPSDGNNDVTVSKENGCDNKTEQPDASKEAEKTEAPKKDDNVEGSEETKNTTKDEQPKQSDKDDQVKDAEKDDLTKDTDKDEAQTMFSDSESTRGKGELTRPSPRQRTITDKAPPKQDVIKKVTEMQGVVIEGEERAVLGRDASSVLH